ncbi:unnamed protein product [Lactuca saligna]|uniref:chloroplast protein-transporting ATPase n=1 Tax=Lactuca saligna TaxID=75948 RepID=A0AA35VND2_LACSI|nr:unnamed protein product [Lactuca saligna]
MDVGNAKTDVVAVSVDHNFSTYLHNGFLSIVPGKKDSGIMLQRNKCQFSGIDESSAISAVMEGVHCLEQLQLNKNNIERIWYPSATNEPDMPFQNLHCLLIGGNKIQETSSIDALNSYPGLMSSGPCCLTIQLMDVGNAKTDVVAVSVDHNFSTYLHNGFLSVVPGKKDSGIMLQRNKCQFSGIDESSAISAVMEGVHVVNGLEYKMYCSSSKFDGFQKNSIQMVKPAKGTTTLAFIFKEVDGESGKKRRWSKGIHLAVEAKEGLPIQADSVVVAQITYQSMFKLYPKLSGMIGTAKTEHPTFIAFYHTSILFKKDIFHKALYFENYTTYGYSSKYVGKSENKSWTYEKAKSIISESIEMSQSMGLDELQRLVEEQAEMYPLGPCIAIAYLSVLKDCEIHCFHEGLEVKRLGGLHVIGTSLHESRRIDNQLRGRAGRQGDPGSTRFMVR